MWSRPTRRCDPATSILTLTVSCENALCFYFCCGGVYYSCFFFSFSYLYRALFCLCLCFGFGFGCFVAPYLETCRPRGCHLLDLGLCLDHGTATSNVNGPYLSYPI